MPPSIICIRLAVALILGVMLALSLPSQANAATDTKGEKPTLTVVLDYVMPEQRADRKYRTPETIDTALALDLAKRLNLTLAPVQQGQATASLEAGKGGVKLTTLDAAAALPRGLVAIPIAYRSAPMAIMRSDTTIKRWEDLKGRTVCVSESGNHLGVAARHGAIEKVFPAPADALIAVRVGTCDATVHDAAMLEELIRLPEWKKFSARLTAGPSRELAFVAPAADTEALARLKQVAREWRSRSYPQELMKKAVRSIAFEVYLDQDVPDCH